MKKKIFALSLLLLGSQAYGRDIVDDFVDWARGTKVRLQEELRHTADDMRRTRDSLVRKILDWGNEVAMAHRESRGVSDQVASSVEPVVRASVPMRSDAEVDALVDSVLQQLNEASGLTNPVAPVVSSEASEVVVARITNKQMLTIGAVAFITIGAVTYILYRNGAFQPLSDFVAKHPHYAMASSCGASALIGIAAWYGFIYTHYGYDCIDELRAVLK